MDENKQDILSEIFAKADQPAPPRERPRFEYPLEDDPLPSPPPAPSGEKRTRAEKLLPWLCMILGCALLVMGICLLQLARVNNRLDSLEEAVESVALVDQLQRDNKLLQQQQEELEVNLQFAESRLREQERLEQAVYTRLYSERDMKDLLNYQWYLDQFMRAEDYPMAAALIMFTSGQDQLNSAQFEQYQAYTQQLIDRGYLKTELLPTELILDSQPPDTSLSFTDQWDPSKNDDMAAMSLLWCALDAYFVQGIGGYEAAAQYLYLYPLGSPNSGYQDRVNRLASNFTLKQFQEMKDGLVENENLTIEEDGAMTRGSGFSSDVLYNLPFELPEDALIYIPVE